MRKMSILITTEDFAALHFLVTLMLWNLSAAQVASLRCSWGVRYGFCSHACPEAAGGLAWSLQYRFHQPIKWVIFQLCKGAERLNYCLQNTFLYLNERRRMSCMQSFFFFFNKMTLQDLLHTRNENLSLESNTVTIAINLHNPQVTPGCWV